MTFPDTAPDAAPDTASVRPGEELPLEPLREYLRGRLGGEADDLAVEQFPGGHSNLTYLLRFGGREHVLRRAPLGSVAPKAHDMARECRLLTRVHPVFPAAPRPTLLCEDTGVIGAVFYLMERRRGVVVRSRLPREYAALPDAGRRVSEALVDTLADLHRVDVEEAGLLELGRPEGFLGRQVEGWAGRWRRAQVEDAPRAEAVIAWLEANLPAGGEPALVHNDYKLDNLMFSPDDPGRVVAVLDWEMATAGDPLVDLGLSLCYWTQRGFPEGARTPLGEPGAAQGFLTREGFLERYAARSGRDVAGVAWYEVLGVFKLAVIVGQIYARYRAGQTRDERFAPLGEQARSLVREAARRIEEA